MMRRLALSLLMAFCLITVPASASAVDLFGGNPSTGQICSGAGKGDTDPNSSAVCVDSKKTTDNPLTGTNGLIIKIANIVAYIAGVAAVILILIGSLRFITAGGDSSKAATARRTVINALIGIVIIVLAKTLIVFVVSRI